MREIIMLQPVLKEMIWGGSRLREEFHYDIPCDHTGECWAVSAHKNGDCMIQDGTFQGKSLSWLWQNHRELFGNVEGNEFPLLVKIIDAKTDLSIQVHPDDEYARVHEDGALGKTECWYILDCDEDATIVIGHNASSKEELKDMIDQKKWSELIKFRKISKGDFFQINPGTVHAIKGGTLILETQQSSDITYRLYDYDRLQNGKPRELHLEKSIDVITCPHEEVMISNQNTNLQHAVVYELISCKYYTVERVVVNGRETFKQTEPFMLFSVIDGSGMIDNRKVEKGNHFILPANYGDYTVEGDLELIVSYL
ncbi:mannose-6-phosphate isomerase, class I [Anaeromicropila populeti]|uniref:mannose-6-phosphate isomerase n=1 Tax=Anaeromicropila populeti TaxID=37658 RepID=A0A1I6IQR3_9FIRM|nr:mannose-6-phosphate isomerase, class I [Anaeromicropila populeti]SFR69058.1 mannose-6-phosphate isomerase, type 1 [Anaeromicropila populeti]